MGSKPKFNIYIFYYMWFVIVMFCWLYEFLEVTMFFKLHLYILFYKMFDNN